MSAGIVILDNRDSFVRNIGHRLDELGAPWRIVPAHATRLDELAAFEPTGLVVSPGPQGPDEAGVSTAAIRALAVRGTPILGVCLGHQCIAAAWDVPVRPTEHARHGRASPIAHDGRGLLDGLPSPFPAARYHALAAAEPAPGSPLEVSARLDDDSGLVMGLRHRRLPVEGVQFHPESVLTPLGFRILAAFAARCGYPVSAELVAGRVEAAQRLVAGRR
jgi:anthranilate synthase/aminodeoxychorismate synthase-like glutamine amidotransferase